jgi:hypothetical protein
MQLKEMRQTPINPKAKAVAHPYEMQRARKMSRLRKARLGANNLLAMGRRYHPLLGLGTVAYNFTPVVVSVAAPRGVFVRLLAGGLVALGFRRRAMSVRQHTPTCLLSSHSVIELSAQILPRPYFACDIRRFATPLCG